MLKRWVLPLIASCLGLASLAGCAAAPQADMPAPVPSGDYDRVFDAAVAVLREHRFTVRRMDRRYGRITTYPRTAASFFEPWHPDADSPYNGENALNHQRRTVDVTLEPTATPGEYGLEVGVALERRQHPERHLNSAAFASELHFVRGEGVRTIRTERGYTKSHWRDVGPDEPYARRLTAEILAAAAPPAAAAVSAE